ncbi:MAG: TetR/AcrR family transcriptional regulator [Lachnospiraceae bacterium]
MKQEEKSKRTYEKILNAAIVEFGDNGYDNGSLNTICKNYNISKGLIYHHFENKDELYLSCVEQAFQKITEFLNQSNYNEAKFSDNIQKLIDLRYQFFHENPHYSNIFFGTVLQPPKHLTDRIKQIRRTFDDFNAQQYRKIIENVTLREDVSKEEALEYFFVFQEMFNGYFQSKAYENTDFHSLIDAHEMKLSKVLNIMLYGIAKEKTNDSSINF